MFCVSLLDDTQVRQFHTYKRKNTIGGGDADHPPFLTITVDELLTGENELLQQYPNKCKHLKCLSSKRFREIEPTKIPSRCLKVHRRAFLDEDKNGARRHVEDSDPDLADREICRLKFAEVLEDPTKTLKGARNFPYELVADVRKNGAPTDLQRQTMNAMWAAIVVEVKKQIAEQKAKDALAKTGERIRSI